MSETSERSIRPLKDTNIIKLTFCCKFWGHSLCMTLFGWVWYLWPKMASKSSKMSQEFWPSPWILSKLLGYYTLPLPHLLGSQSPPVPLLTIWDNSVLNKFNQPIKQAWRKELVFFLNCMPWPMMVIWWWKQRWNRLNPRTVATNLGRFLWYFSEETSQFCAILSFWENHKKSKTATSD